MLLQFLKHFMRKLAATATKQCAIRNLGHQSSSNEISKEKQGHCKSSNFFLFFVAIESIYILAKYIKFNLKYINQNKCVVNKTQLCFI